MLSQLIDMVCRLVCLKMKLSTYDATIDISLYVKINVLQNPTCIWLSVLIRPQSGNYVVLQKRSLMSARYLYVHVGYCYAFTRIPKYVP